MADNINHPPHYTATAVEPINVIEAWELGFCLGNTVKYIARCGRKGGDEKRLEDLEKARWYLNREIERLKQLQNQPSQNVTDALRLTL